MSSKIKKIIIFTAIGIIMIFLYVIFLKTENKETNLVSTSENTGIATLNPTSAPSDFANIENIQFSRDFLPLLLSVKNIALDDTLFFDIAFKSLHDSSILLIPDGNEGRVNPFAPINSEITSVPVGNLNLLQSFSIN